MRTALIILTVTIGSLIFPALKGSQTNLHAKTQTSSVYICISPTAHRYHSHMCQGLRNCTHEIREVTIQKAVELGYTACGFCY